MWFTKFRSYWDTLQNPIETAVTLTKDCDITGCPHRGDYKAPKSRRNLKEYYWFCLEHVKEYNQNWDFFKGMSRAEIEQNMSKTTVWDRPTWRSTRAGFNEERIKRAVYEGFATGENIFQSFTSGDEGENARVNVQSIPHPTMEALAVMNLVPPIGWEEVKARYKVLAKRYHPDINAGDKTAEEQIKKINLAYSILKLSYQNYTKLDEQ
ncbi:MAG: J domain-containing protein [Proteobacteria bacterium]|nr:J domain-containing protein [Pseudomonadota bacterium]